MKFVMANIYRDSRTLWMSAVGPGGSGRSAMRRNSGGGNQALVLYIQMEYSMNVIKQLEVRATCLPPRTTSMNKLTEGRAAYCNSIAVQHVCAIKWLIDTEGTLSAAGEQVSC